jgi:hypothetical protein
MAKRILVQATTPLGYVVVLTRDRWREIVRFKHPAVESHQAAIRECLESPDVIRASAKDPDVHVYYSQVGRNYLCVVAAPQRDGRYFVVTIYLTKRIKQGDELWTK